MTKRPEMLGPWAIVHWPRGANKRKPCTLTRGQGPDCFLRAVICHLPTRWRCAPHGGGRSTTPGDALHRLVQPGSEPWIWGCGIWDVGILGLEDMGMWGAMGVQASRMRDVGFGDLVI